MRWLALIVACALPACGKTIAPPVKPEPARRARAEIDAVACGELQRNLGDAAASLSAWDKRGGVRKPRFTYWTGQRFGYLARELGEFEWSPSSQSIATELRDVWVSIGDSLEALSRAIELGETAAAAKIAGAVRRSNARREGIETAVDQACSAQDEQQGKPWVAPERVEAVVRGAMTDVVACYDRGRAREPELQGRLVVLFGIDRRGRARPVADVSVESDSVETGKTLAPIEDEAVIACVLEVFEGLRFPLPGNGVVQVTYPLLLTPELRAP